MDMRNMPADYFKVTEKESNQTRI